MPASRRQRHAADVSANVYVHTSPVLVAGQGHDFNVFCGIEDGCHVVLDGEIGVMVNLRKGSGRPFAFTSSDEHTPYGVSRNR